MIRTRVCLCDAAQWQGVAEVHGGVFGHVRPANTMIGGVDLIGGYDEKIEAEAQVHARG